MYHDDWSRTPQCRETYEVWRCMEAAHIKGAHESYMANGARLIWTHDKTIALCIQPRHKKESS